MSEHYDCIVIGGGPAGSTTASYMAMKGHSVLIIEREAFPRYRLGESLLPSTNPVLEELGVLDKMEEAGFPHKTGGTFVWGKDLDPWSVIFSENPFLPASYGFHVERSLFDAILLDRSRELGVEIRQPATATGVIQEAGQVVGVTYKVEGSRDVCEARGRFVVDCSGPSAIVGKKVTTRTYDERMRQLALYTYYRDVVGEPEDQEGHVIVTASRKGWFWFIPMNSKELGDASVGLVTGQEYKAEIAEKGMEQFFQECLAETPQVQAMLGPDARISTPIRAIKDWAFVCSELAGPGYFLCGDAAAFMDPLLSTGVTLAMLAGYSASICMHSILEDPEMEDKAIAFYDGNYKRMYSVTRDCLLYFYSGNDVDSEGIFWQSRKIMKFGNNACAKQSFSHLVNTVAANPHPSARRQIHMFHQFIDNLEHPVDEMAEEESFQRLQEEKAPGSGLEGLCDTSVPVVNGRLDSTCIIDEKRHVLRPVRGVAYDEERPVFSSTASWLLGRNFAELEEGPPLELLDLMDGERSWSQIVDAWAQAHEMDADAALEVLAPALSALCDEHFVRIQAPA
jgi:flavin-dependent dehydrogenase